MLKFIGASVITFLIAGPLSFIVEGVNNKDVPYAIIVAVKCTFAVVAQAIAVAAAIYLFRLRGGVLDNEISRGRIRESPLTLAGTVKYIFETGKINVAVYIFIAATATVITAAANSTASLPVQALYNPLFFTNQIPIYLFGNTALTLITGQLLGTAIFPLLYLIELYAMQRIRFKKYNKTT